MNKRLSVMLILLLLILPFSTSGHRPVQDQGEQGEQGRDRSYLLHTAGRYALGAGLLIGVAALQSIVENQLQGYGPLARMGHYLFYPLTMSISLVTLTPFLSWFRHAIHGISGDHR